MCGRIHHNRERTYYGHKKNALENDSRKTILEPLKKDLMIRLLV